MVCLVSATEVLHRRQLKQCHWALALNKDLRGYGGKKKNADTNVERRRWREPDPGPDEFIVGEGIATTGRRKKNAKEISGGEQSPLE